MQYVSKILKLQREVEQPVAFYTLLFSGDYDILHGIGGKWRESPPYKCTVHHFGILLLDNEVKNHLISVTFLCDLVPIAKIFQFLCYDFRKPPESLNERSYISIPNHLRVHSIRKNIIMQR